MKTQMKLANRAWRNITKEKGWRYGWKGGSKTWKEFCRDKAYSTVFDCDVYLENQEHANHVVRTEINYWS